MSAKRLRAVLLVGDVSLLTPWLAFAEGTPRKNVDDFLLFLEKATGGKLVATERQTLFAKGVKYRLGPEALAEYRRLGGV